MSKVSLSALQPSSRHLSPHHTACDGTTAEFTLSVTLLFSHVWSLVTFLCFLSWGKYRELSSPHPASFRETPAAFTEIGNDCYLHACGYLGYSLLSCLKNWLFLPFLSVCLHLPTLFELNLLLLFGPTSNSEAFSHHKRDAKAKTLKETEEWVESSLGIFLTREILKHCFSRRRSAGEGRGKSFSWLGHNSALCDRGARLCPRFAGARTDTPGSQSSCYRGCSLAAL